MAHNSHNKLDKLHFRHLLPAINEPTPEGSVKQLRFLSGIIQNSLAALEMGRSLLTTADV